MIGGGAWGTALAQVAAAERRARPCSGRASPRSSRRSTATTRIRLFLPGARASTRRSAPPAISTRLAGVRRLAGRHPGPAPARGARRGCRAAGKPLVLCAKGIEEATGLLMHEVAREVQPERADRRPVRARPSPMRSPPACRPRSPSPSRTARSASGCRAGIARPLFRPYLSDDVTGAEIGGAVKNVLAIACGVVEGRGLGQNARAALISRGFAEMTRFGLAKGARAETLAGLVGPRRPRPHLLVDELAQLQPRQGPGRRRDAPPSCSPTAAPSRKAPSPRRC